ncbi:hypothetical protein B0H14DRAFT_3894679 [Mycena olivaceomarginata]|nr:hypothetical protein B0H14DRAFT_3894679 [Mycena olivaceomarginata]
MLLSSTSTFARTIKAFPRTHHPQSPRPGREERIPESFVPPGALATHGTGACGAYEGCSAMRIMTGKAIVPRYDSSKAGFEYGTVHTLLVTWFVNVKFEARFEAAKELLASLGIDNSETSLFHGTAANSIQPILEGGFLIPGVSSGGKMANGKTEGYGIYLAPTASASLGIPAYFGQMRFQLVEFQTKSAMLSLVHWAKMAMNRGMVRVQA